MLVAWRTCRKQVSFWSSFFMIAVSFCLLARSLPLPPLHIYFLNSSLFFILSLQSPGHSYLKTGCWLVKWNSPTSDYIQADAKKWKNYIPQGIKTQCRLPEDQALTQTKSCLWVCVCLSCLCLPTPPWDKEMWSLKQNTEQYHIGFTFWMINC